MRKFILAFVLLAGGMAVMGQYSIDWYTIDGGGGSSTGGVYTVTGTIGQPDAGRMSGGNYTLQGGFWGIIGVVQTEGSPRLWIESSGPGVVLRWPAPSTGWVLQEISSLSSTNWSNVGATPVVVGTNNTVTITPATGNRYFRLKQ